jgi:hypothetical protein
VAFPRFTAAGIGSWGIGVYASDAAGNAASYSSAQLAAAGLRSTITVTP